MMKMHEGWDRRREIESFSLLKTRVLKYKQVTPNDLSSFMRDAESSCTQPEKAMHKTDTEYI